MSEQQGDKSENETAVKTVHLGYDDLTGWRVRSYLSNSHLLAAVYFARQSAEIEKMHEGQGEKSIEALGEPIPSQGVIDTHRGYVLGSIFATVSFLEALINELLADAKDEPRSNRMKQFEADRLHSLGSVWGIVGSKLGFPFLDKYQLTLITLGQKPFEIDGQPYQDVTLVRKLRNDLIHFQPEWHVGREAYEDRLHKWEKDLRAKRIASNPFTAPKAPYFPDRLLGYGCAEWVVNSSMKFTDEFFGKLKVTPSYDDIRHRLNLA